MQHPVKPFWLRSDSYMVYEQFFEWASGNMTERMQWNVTGIRDDLVDLSLLSHGVDTSSEDISITESESTWTINTFSRGIVADSESGYVGKKWPFWISTNVEVGSSVDTMYGFSSISGREPIAVLNESHDCWVVEYRWSTSNMKRWYDTSSGLCLKIFVVLEPRNNLTIIITETAVQTNISSER
jgi:hypothetical protein